MNDTYFTNPHAVIYGSQIIFVVLAYLLILLYGVSLSPLGISAEPLRKLCQSFNFTWTNVALGALVGLLMYFLACGYVLTFDYLRPGSTWTQSPPSPGFMNALLGHGAAAGF